MRLYEFDTGELLRHKGYRDYDGEVPVDCMPKYFGAHECYLGIFSYVYVGDSIEVDGITSYKLNPLGYNSMTFSPMFTLKAAEGESAENTGHAMDICWTQDVKEDTILL